MFKKDTSIIIKIASYGAYVVMFSIIWFVYSLVNNNIHEDIVIDFSKNMIGEEPFLLVGTMITGFLSHMCIMPIIRENKGFSQVNLNVFLG